MKFNYKNISKMLCERTSGQVKAKESLFSVMIMQDLEWSVPAELVCIDRHTSGKIFFAVQGKAICSGEYSFLKLLYGKILKLILAVQVLHR